MALKPGQFENPHTRAAQTPGEWRLILSPKPRARLMKYLTLPAELNNGITVEKYSTRFGANFEAHIQANGVVTWWKLVKVSEL
jgi:hypothetical protein